MSEKKLKRIEINEKVGPIRGRISRTGGITGAVSPVKGVTLNTKHGARVSKTYKGLTLGLQNFNSVVRGRWSTKDKKVNVVCETNDSSNCTFLSLQKKKEK